MTRTGPRSSRSIQYEDGEQAYILAPQRLAVGDKVIAGAKVDIKPGNAMPFSGMPIGTIVHNIELKPGKGGQIARAAGTYAQFVGRDGGYAQIRLSLGRAASGASGMHGDRRCRVEPRQLEPELRQGRPHAPQGHASRRPRCRHEPDRPPAWWW